MGLLADRLKTLKLALCSRWLLVGNGMFSEALEDAM